MHTTPERTPETTCHSRSRTLRQLLQLVAVAFLLCAGPSTAEVRFDWISVEEQHQLLDAHAANEAELMNRPSTIAEPGQVMLLPYFEVDASGFTESTLIAVANNSLISATTFNISYWDTAGNLTALALDVPIPAAGVHTINLRDVQGLPTDSEGFKRGYVYVASPAAVSADYFQVDPMNNFATGGRLIDDDERCFVYNFRFLQGGGFDGGTRVRMFVDSPLGVLPSDPPTASFTLSAENGTVLGDVALRTDEVISEFGMDQILAALPSGPGPSITPAFGAVTAIMSASAGYGLIETTYSANDRYSASMQASCVTLAP